MIERKSKQIPIWKRNEKQMKRLKSKKFKKVYEQVVNDYCKPKYLNQNQDGSIKNEPSRISREISPRPRA